MQIRKGIEYHSLYEYLGHPAGPKLGEKVNKASIKTKQKYVTQHVEQGDFKGEVFCYTKEFLNEYFHVKQQINKYPEPETEEDLPF
jgi:hypothetical protein